MAEPLPQGLLVQFDSPERLLTAVRAARDAKAEGIDAFTPFPVDELNQLLDIHDNRVPWLGLIGGLFGLFAAYAIQIGTNLDFPLDIGGRPLVTLQAFALIGFELTVLCSVGFMVIGFFAINHLPRYHQPMFWVRRFEHATRDGFFLYLETRDEQALHDRRALAETMDPVSIDEVPR